MKNLQGDITEITDADSNTVAKYVYDAWGNHEVYATVGGETILVKDISGNIVNGTVSLNAAVMPATLPFVISSESAEQAVIDLTKHISMLNPIRYRGYYYDTETSLYYLQTRYYDPQVGRFINADDISYLDPENINGLNLYAYCGNNPVMLIDEYGNKPKWWQWLLFGIGMLIITGLVAGAIFTGGALSVVLAGAAIGAIGGAIGSTVSTAISGDWSNFGNSFFIGTLSGAISGAVAASSLGIVGQIGVNAALEIGNYVVPTALSGGRISLGGLLVNGALGSVAGLVG